MSRDEVIKGLEQFIADFKPFAGNNADWKRVKDALALLNEEPKRGRWEGWTGTHWTGKCDDVGDPEYKEHVVYHCSLCGRRTVIREAYCPTCGAKMEEED